MHSWYKSSSILGSGKVFILGAFSSHDMTVEYMLGVSRCKMGGEAGNDVERLVNPEAS